MKIFWKIKILQYFGKSWQSPPKWHSVFSGSQPLLFSKLFFFIDSKLSRRNIMWLKFWRFSLNFDDSCWATCTSPFPFITTSPKNSITNLSPTFSKPSSHLRRTFVTFPKQDWIMFRCPALHVCQFDSISTPCVQSSTHRMMDLWEWCETQQ